MSWSKVVESREGTHATLSMVRLSALVASVAGELLRRRFSMPQQHGEVMTVKQLSWVLQSATIFPSQRVGTSRLPMAFEAGDEPEPVYNFCLSGVFLEYYVSCECCADKTESSPNVTFGSCSIHNIIHYAHISMLACFHSLAQILYAAALLCFLFITGTCSCCCCCTCSPPALIIPLAAPSKPHPFHSANTGTTAYNHHPLFPTIRAEIKHAHVTQIISNIYSVNPGAPRSSPAVRSEVLPFRVVYLGRPEVSRTYCAPKAGAERMP